MEDVTIADIESVVTNFIDATDRELFAKKQVELESHWHFRWEDNRCMTHNIYQFHELLSLYGWNCKRWEEHHNGSYCIVERVRDQYLMPKIREFEKELRARFSKEAP